MNDAQQQSTQHRPQDAESNMTKETIRTASVVEIYNEAISDLLQKKRDLQSDLLPIQAARAAAATLKILLQLASVFAFLFGLLLFLAGIYNLTPQDNTGASAAIVIGSLMLIAGYFMRNLAKSKTKVLAEKARHLEHQIYKVNKEIESRSERKRSLLEAEEVIVSRDLKVEKLHAESPSVEPFSEANTSPTGKVCPMCAESIKAAAIVCRYCGHKFALK